MPWKTEIDDEDKSYKFFTLNLKEFNVYLAVVPIGRAGDIVEQAIISNSGDTIYQHRSVSTIARAKEELKTVAIERFERAIAEIRAD